MDNQDAHHFIGIDVGTGSARACIVDRDGKLIASCSHDTRTYNSSPGCYEQSTQNIWQSICRSVRDAIAEARIHVDTVRSITFAATCSLAVFADNPDEPVSVSAPSFHGNDHNVILWMHRNATKEAELINSLNHESIRYLGGSISPLMALPKVLWLKNNMPREPFLRCKFFDLHDALSYIATGGQQPPGGALSDGLSLARGFGIDGEIKGWTPEFLKDIGLEELANDMLRTVGGLDNSGRPSSPGTSIGKLCEKAAKELGLSTDVVVASGMIDCYAGWVGTVGAQYSAPTSSLEVSPYQRLAVVAGTSACHILASNQNEFVQGLWGPYKDFLLPETYVMAGGQNAVGRLLEHVLDTHPAISDAKQLAKSQEVSIFDYLNHHLTQMQNNTSAPNVTYLGRHLFFYGDYFGNRSPIADPSLKAAIVGLDGDKSIDNLAVMYYGALEFLALQTRHIITTMKQGKHEIRAIFMSGSLCLNHLFIDLLSTTCDLPVITPAYIHAAVCYGSALLGATAFKKAQDPNQTLWSVMESMSKPGKLFLPSEDRYMKDLLDVKVTVFLELAERQRVFRSMIDNVPNGSNRSRG